MKPLAMVLRRAVWPTTAWRRTLLLLPALALAGCALEVENRQAAQQLAQERSAPGSVYLGWRVFHDKCAACHGADATGSVAAPDLLPIVRDMGVHRFVSLVLMRYDWNLPVAKNQPDDAARYALVNDIVQRKEAYVLTMPPWQQEPRINAHIADLYAYLSARAQGLQGLGRPSPDVPPPTAIYRAETPPDTPER